MAEPKTAPPTSGDAGSGAPKLVAVPEAQRPPARAPATPPATQPAEPRRGVSRGVVALLALLLLLALAGLAAQTQRAGAQAERITALEGELSGLRDSLATATGQLASYDRTLGQVRGTVSELFERIAQLNALVQTDPRAPAEPAPTTAAPELR